MRTIHYRKNCMSYICLLGWFSILLTLYIVGLKQSKQVGTNFNLKPKYKRDTRTQDNRGGIRLSPQGRVNKIQSRRPSTDKHVAVHKLADNNNDIRVDNIRESNVGGRYVNGNYVNGKKGNNVHNDVIINEWEDDVDRAPGSSRGHGGFDDDEDRLIGQIGGAGLESDLDRDRGPGDRGAEQQGGAGSRLGDADKPFSGDDTPLNVYIVEEHHEVLPYWFMSANRGVIPKSGNTLVHIDGHSDLAPTMNVPGYPAFKWPAEKQLKFLMQENDVFIQASVMAGLINRVIWVWPPWDSPNHDDNYVSATLSLGWVKVENKGHTSRAFCMCARNQTGLECRSRTPVTRDGGEDSTEMFDVSPDLCNIRKTLIVEEMHESVALAHFNKTNWATRGENIMLDIDEDYFGCSYAVEQMLRANLSLPRILNIDRTLKTTFCPRNSSDEKETDRFIMDLIAVIRKKRACAIDPKLKGSKICKTVQSVNENVEFIKTLNSLVLAGKITVCSSVSFNATKSVNLLISIFSKLRIKQLIAIQATGFCSSTSPKTYVVDGRKRTFGLCYGMNTPDNTAVLEHTPTPKEIVRRKIILRTILSKVGRHRPSVVTIARSVRDGYTPRKYFEDIESGILQALNTTMKRPLHLHYDKDLLGGKPGWPSRHKV